MKSYKTFLNKVCDDHGLENWEFAVDMLGDKLDGHKDLFTLANQAAIEYASEFKTCRTIAKLQRDEKLISDEKINKEALSYNVARLNDSNKIQMKECWKAAIELYKEQTK